MAAVLGALAIAAPIAEVGAATTPDTYTGVSFDAAGVDPGFPFDWVPLAFVDPSVGPRAVAIGPTVINDVFNGATVVISSNEAAYSLVIASP